MVEIRLLYWGLFHPIKRKSKSADENRVSSNEIIDSSCEVSLLALISEFFHWNYTGN